MRQLCVFLFRHNFCMFWYKEGDRSMATVDNYWKKKPNLTNWSIFARVVMVFYFILFIILFIYYIYIF